MTPPEEPGRPALTYREIGSTAGALPAGYHHNRHRRVVGRGRDAFGRGAAALLSWQVHRGAGLRIAVDAPPVAVGVDVVMKLGTDRLGLLIPCRVVYVVDEPDRRGFAYGTLPGHPETGEERFVLELTGDGAVVFETVVFSNAARWYTRLAGPSLGVVQKLALRRYAWSCARLT